MKVAYADPPYLGCCSLYGHRHDGECVVGCWDDARTHGRLIDYLVSEFPDGWALSLHTPSLRAILPMCPDDVRIAAWVKTFASFKPNVNPAYAWEPVIWRGGRVKRSRQEPTVRDWVGEPITLKKGLTGAKPEPFVWWLLHLMGVEPHDEIIDLFPGTGVVGRVADQFMRQKSLFAV